MKTKKKIDYFDINKESNKVNNIIKNIYYISVFIFKLLIIINSYQQIKCKELYLYSSKITLKIKGIGEYNILGTNINSMNYLKEVYINNIKQTIKDSKYYFNQIDNFVELIWDDNLNDCASLFHECAEIYEINLSNFNTSQVTSMQNMFCSCSSLTSINLSNLNTSKVISMSYMFESCSSLTSLNLSNFNTSQVSDLSYMFNECMNLEYINLYNLDESHLEVFNDMFTGVPENAVFCLNETALPEIFEQISKRFIGECLVIDCSDDWKSKQKKIINDDLCVESCDKHTQYIQYKYEYNGKCVESCPNGFIYDEINKCKCELDKCLKCTNVSLDKNLCTKCNTNYHPKENDPENRGEYINCYNQAEEGYYLDNYFNLYKKCYNSCKTCNRAGNDKFHNCTKCNDNFTLGIKRNNYFNCYKNCSYYYYFDNENNFQCTNDSSCPIEYPKLIENTKECIKLDNSIEYTTTNLLKYENDENIITTKNSINLELSQIIDTTINKINHEIYSILETTINIINNEINKYDYTTINSINSEINQSSDTIINKIEAIETVILKEEEIKYYDNIIQNIENKFTSEKYDTSNLDKGHDEIITNGRITTTLTTSKNQRNNINNNMTRIDLGECENILRNYYNISINESLYIKKIDIQQKGMKTLKVEYDVYARLFGMNLIKLNLTICKKTKISILIPILITDNLDKYNSSSEYYNDICYTTTSEDGTDILLKDRQKEFIDKDKIVCQEDCDFSEYDYSKFVAKCICKVKQRSESFADMNINKAKLLENFINIKNIVNFIFLKCYKKLLNKLGILYNIGFYILLAIIIFHIISIFVLTIKQFSSLKNKIKKLSH